MIQSNEFCEPMPVSDSHRNVLGFAVHELSMDSRIGLNAQLPAGNVEFALESVPDKDDPDDPLPEEALL